MTTRPEAMQEIHDLIQRHREVLGPTNDGGTTDPELSDPVGQCLLEGFVILTSWTDIEAPADAYGVAPNWTITMRSLLSRTQAMGMAFDALEIWKAS